MNAATRPSRLAGVSLVELLVALSIGTFLIGGALSVYIKSRETYLLNETLARMQENASFALKQLEPDIQLAGYWGAHADVGSVEGRANGSTPVLGVIVSNDCDATNNWAVDTTNYLIGSDDDRPDWDCLGAFQANTDTLTVRRASGSPVTALVSGPVYIRSSANPRSRLFTGTASPTGFPPEAQNFLLHSRAYYVRPYSMTIGGDNDTIPSLRRLDLSTVGTTPTVVDREVVQGVENMQIQLGIDSDGDRAVDAYVNSDNPLVATSKVMSVRVWLLIRADSPEVGYVDDIEYTLGNLVRSGTNDNFRRLLVTRTILLRNRT